MRIVTEQEIAGAHFLPNYDGKCKNLHGHNWLVKVALEGIPLDDGPNQGMLLDFSTIKNTINEFDHKSLNDVLENPTAENISILLCRKLMEVVDDNIARITVRVYETSKGYAEICSDDKIIMAREEEEEEEAAAVEAVQKAREADKDIEREGEEEEGGDNNDDAESE
jgi:6-pyruvoyltetrahydropterin/6-carboxytetrahydropterin synthase